MDIEVRQLQDVTVLELRGRLVLGTGDEALRRAIEKRIAAGNNRLVLNLSQVTYADSAGIGEMVAATKKAQGAGGDLTLAGAQDRVRDLLGLFPHVLKVYDSEEEAVRSL